MPKVKIPKTRRAEYTIWIMARNRCHNPKARDYKYYGARGIKMCDEWRNNFAAFYDHIGPRPSKGMTLDRYPNRLGNYEPGNCRWTSWKDQQNNRRDNHLITFQNKTMTLSQWAEETGINLQTLSTRIFALQWTYERALSTKGDARRKRA